MLEWDTANSVRVHPDGELLLLAQNLPIDAASAVGDGAGNVYFASPSGIYRIYQEQPD